MIKITLLSIREQKEHFAVGNSPLWGPGLQLFCKRRHRPVVYNHTSGIVLSPNHDSGFGDSNQIPLLSRLGFDSNHFLRILQLIRWWFGQIFISLALIELVFPRKWIGFWMAVIHNSLFFNQISIEYTKNWLCKFKYSS